MWPFGKAKWQGTGKRRRTDGSPPPPAVTPRMQRERWDNVRPDWRALRDLDDRADARERLVGAQPFSGAKLWFDHATAGELPGPDASGPAVEVLLWQLTEVIRSGHTSYDAEFSGVALWFPHALPTFGVYPPGPRWRPTPRDFRGAGERTLYECDAAAAGPRFEGVKVMVADGWTSGSLITPEVLGRPQLIGRHWRLDGNLAVAWGKGRSSPELLEECALDLHATVASIPRELMEMAARRVDSAGQP